MDKQKTSSKAGQVFKWVLYIALAIIIIVIVIFVVRYAIKKLKPSADKGSVKEAEKSVNENNLSFDKPDYSQMADRLFTAMDKYTLATVESSSVKAVMNQLKNSDDWNALYSAFGVKEANYTLPFNKAFKGNLTQWMQDTLSKDDLSEIGGILQGINVNVF